MDNFAILFDGDEFLYKASRSAQLDTTFGPVGEDGEETGEGSQSTFDMDKAWRDLQATVSGLVDTVLDKVSKEDSGIYRVVVCLSDTENFRKKICPKYKTNRVVPKPVGYRELEARWKEQDGKWGTTFKTFPGLEADDVMGILATRPSDSIPVIVSTDKDMTTIPAMRYDPYHKRWSHPTEEESLRFFCLQTLMGDATDGVTGIPGVGPKKAEALLGSKVETLWCDVLSAYDHHRGKLGDEDYIEAANRNARLVRILRDSDWDSETCRPKKWWYGQEEIWCNPPR